MQVKVELKELEDLGRELTVEVEPDLVNEKLDARYQEVRKGVTIKGFRKGKAPMHMIKSMYESEVRADVADDVIKATLPQAVQEKELRVAATPAITALDYRDNGGITYTAKLEVFPEIETVTTDGLKVTTREIEVADEEVEEAIESIRKTAADRREVNREVRAGDVVVVDLKKIYDPQLLLTEDSFPESVIDLDHPHTLQVFKDQLPGMKAGEKKELEVNYHKNYSEPRFAGATITYEVAVTSVQEQILPEFDDHFAKATQQAETALELRMKIRKNIQEQKKDELRRMQKNEIVRQICENNKVPIPNGLVNEYLDGMIEDIKRSNPGLDEAEARNSYQGVAVNTLRWNLLYHKLAQQERIEVLPADTENAIKRFAENYNMTMEQAKDALQKSGRVTSIRDTILEQKVFEFLLNKAEVVKSG